MLINADAKQLDWVCAAYLAKDEVAIQEIKDGSDLHSCNQRAFGLPSRLIAKVFLFRIIFGGTAYSFAKDNDFAECKFSLNEWEGVIERFYRKYKGIKLWHEQLVRTATTTGFISIPTGRTWKFDPVRNFKGELQWPITSIKNYPVQGLEADLMSLARVSLYNRIKKYDDILLVNTVHDSLLLDVPKHRVDLAIEIIRGVFQDVPANFRKLFGVDFILPFRGEISIGDDWLNMEEIKGVCG